MTEERSLRSRLSADRQTLQVHAITGTPWDVPVPKKVMIMN
jgi:hypothetical protein